MQFLRRWSTVSASLLLLTSHLYADTVDSGEGIEDRDIQALREWVNTKRQVTVKEKGGALSISGEVRSEFQHTFEKINGVSQRRRPFLPSDAFDVEVNLMMDYRTDTTWASV